MSRHSCRGVVLAALVLAPVVLPAQRVERYTLDGPDVAVYNLAGTMRVEGGTGSTVVVEVTRGGRDAARLAVQTGDVRGRQALRIVYPSDRVVYPDRKWGGRTTLRVGDDGTFGDDGRGIVRTHRVEITGDGSGDEAWADLRVIVPRGRRLAVRTGVGETTVENVDGQLSVSVAASRVRASHVRGSLSLDTGSGGVEVTDMAGDLRLDTGSGGAMLDGVKGDVLHMDIGSGSVRGRAIEVRELVGDVGSGGVRLDDVRAPRLRLDTGSGSTDIDLVGPVEDVAIDAGSGGVTLRMPASTGATVDIETGSGGVESDFDVKVQRVERRALRGTMGDGRGRIHIEAGSGSVRLKKR